MNEQMFYPFWNTQKVIADSVGQDQFFYPDKSTGTAEPRPAQALYNEGFARRKVLTDAANEKFIQLFCCFQK